jgi:hypothetical protein
MLVAALPLLTALALAPTASAGEVPCPAGLDDLDERVDRALDAYAIMDTDAFFAAHRQAREAVGCLEVLLEPEDVAAYHGVSGLAAFLTEDDEGTLRAFSAALAADPGWSLPERVAPDGTVLVELQQQAAGLGPGPRSPLVNVDGFILMVDGEPSLERPAERPCVLQVVTEDWDVLWSGGLSPGEALPPAALDPERFARGSSALAQALGDEGGYDRNTAGRLAYGAAGLGIAAVGLFTASAITSAQRASAQRQCIEDAACVADEDTWTERMDALHHRGVALGWSGAGCTLAAAGLGIGAVLEWRF